mgnify:CR=1 FL=1
MTFSDERFAAEDCVCGKDLNDFLVTIINNLPNYVRNSGLELIHALETERSVTESRLQHGHTAVMSDLG